MIKGKNKGVVFLLALLVFTLLINTAFAISISNVEIKSITSSSARITWDTDVVADGKVRYGKTNALGLTSRHNTYIFEHDQVLQGLESGKTYLFKIESEDINTNLVTDDNSGQLYSFQTKDISPPQKINNLALNSKSKTSISLEWQASQTDDLDHYNVYRNHEKILEVSTASFTDESLQTGTAYSYKVSAVDFSENEGQQSDTLIVTTEHLDITSPDISELKVESTGSTSAAISWTTDEESTSIVYLGTDLNLSDKRGSSNLVTTHSISFEGLINNVKYYFVASSCDKENNCKNSSLVNFNSENSQGPSLNASIPKFYNKGSIDIYGITDPFSSIKLYVNNLNIPIRALDGSEVSEGTFRFRQVQLQKENVIKIVATGISGSKTEKIYRVSVDTEDPILIIDGLPGITSSKNLTIVGTVNEPVTINFFLRFGSKQAPDKIEGISAITKNSSIKLEWNETSEEDFSHYIIYRKDVGPIAITDQKSYNTYTDILVNKNVEYSYRVSVVDKFGKESTLSEAAVTSTSSGLENIEKPSPIDKLIIEKPTEILETNSSFSQSLRIGKDGTYTLLIEVLDRASNRLVIEKTIDADTKKPPIDIISPKSGTFIYENYANEMDIKGITEPNAKVYLYVERTPFGSLDKNFDISGLPNRLENIDDSKLDAKCRLKIAGSNYCNEAADYVTTADGAGNFEFEDVDLTSFLSGGIGIKEVSGSELGNERRLDKSKSASMIFIARDQAGIYNAKKHETRIGTCWSGNQSWDLIPLAQYQSPTLISPQRLADNKENIYFYFNYSYIGRGNDEKVDSVSISRACDGLETLGEKRFNTSCQILPSGGFSTAVNPDGKVTYTQIKLNRAEGMEQFLAEDWKSFANSVSNELTFPMKFTIRYTHKVDGKDVRETQTTCQEVSYVLDNSIIDPRSYMPDWLLYDVVDFLQNSIKTIDKVNNELTKVLQFATVGCVSSGLLRTSFQIIRRFDTFLEEKKFLLKNAVKLTGLDLLKFDVKTEEDQQYCNDVSKAILESQGIPNKADAPNILKGLKLKYFSNQDLERCFPSVASVWETEADLYKFYRFTCDRVFGHQTPSEWTENLKDEDIFQKLGEGQTCQTDQSVFGQALRAEKCEIVAGSFDRNVKNLEGKTCFVRPVSGGKELYVLGSPVQGTDKLYELEALKTSGRATETGYAIKVTENNFLTSQPTTCEQVCTGGSKGKTSENLIFDGTTIPLVDKKGSKDNKIGYTCTTSNTCQSWGQNKEVDYGGKKIKIESTANKGYTSDCFPPKTETSTISDSPSQRVECCCLNTQGDSTPQTYYVFDDLNKYVSPQYAAPDGTSQDSGQQPAFYRINEKGDRIEGTPEKYDEVEWSYRYWKERYQTEANDAKKHFEYNPNRYIEGRDFAACFGQNNWLYDGATVPEGETGELVMIDSRQQHTSAFQCANIGGMQNRLTMLNNIQGALSNCLIDIRETGTSDAAACKEFFTRYVCSTVWQFIDFFSNQCSPFSSSLDELGDDDYAATVGAGFKSITESLADTQSELASEYGNAELNNLLGSGAGGIARKVCLAAFGYDWDFTLQSVLDAAYSQSFESLVQKTTGTREYLTVDPTNAQAKYEYRASWIINPGCDIDSYTADLSCVGRDEIDGGGSLGFTDPLSNIGIASRGIRCDAVGSPDGNNCDCAGLDSEKTKRFFSSGKISQNKLVQESHDEIVTSNYRYDHLKLTLRADRKLRGNLKNSCFPPGHEDGVFYFPLTDKTARDIISCSVDPLSGIFQCPGASNFWSKKGLARIEDLKVNNQDIVSNKITIFKGDDITLTPTVFKTDESPDKCLIAQLTKQGAKSSPKYETININGIHKYPPMVLDENIQPVQNAKSIPKSLFEGCEPSGTCKKDMERRIPTLRVIERDNAENVELEIKFIDSNTDGISLSEDSTDKLEIRFNNRPPQEKVLGNDDGAGWYDIDEKAPVISLDASGVRLKITKAPLFAKGIISSTYSLNIPSVTESETDNIWYLNLGLYEAGENGQCSRYNAGELITYQGSKQERKIRLDVKASAEKANAPKITLSFKDNKDEVKNDQNVILNIGVVDENRLRKKLDLYIASPDGPKSNWDGSGVECNDLERTVDGGEKLSCSVKITKDILAKIPPGKAGAFKIGVEAWDLDDNANKAEEDISLELWCGENRKEGLCLNSCDPRDTINEGLQCGQGLTCCER